MERCWLALGFLTVLPGPRPRDPDPEAFRRAVACYPYVGLLIGGLLLVLAEPFGRLWPPEVAAVLLLAAWLGVTGMLHLDGLLDTADALLLPADRARRLAVLKDPAIGSFAFGVGAVHLLLKAALVAAVPPAALFLAPVWARTLLLLAVWRTPPGGGGLAGRAAGGGAWWGLLPGFLALYLAPLGALLALLLAAGFWRFARDRLGEVRGDVLGALTEVAEVAFLLGAILGPGV